MSMDFNLSGIIVLTGLPGAAKTLRAMEILETAVKEGRPTFQCGINECSLPGVAEWEDPHAWKDLPPRAVLVVDEAQDYFRARPGSVPVPKTITDMERIRHSGVCLVLTTQQPTYLDKHLRGLAQHQHLVEVLAGKTSNCYSFRSVREEVTPASLSDAQFAVYNHPTRLHKFYKSAEAHTKKLRLPFRLKAIAAFALVFLCFVVYRFATRGDAQAEEAPVPATAGTALHVEAPGPADLEHLDPLAWAARLQPRFANMPESAPIFDDRDAVSKPAVYCMSTARTCSCLTEQGTRYVMEYKTCRHIARYGPSYNPFKEPQIEQDGAASRFQAEAPQPVAVFTDAPQITGYGDLGVALNPGP